MRSRAPLALAAVVVVASSTAMADHPECETYAATQPDAMVTNVLVTYTWDPTCGTDPELGPLERDGDPIAVDWSHDTGQSPHEHSAWDLGTTPGVHSYDLTVAPEAEDAYVLHDALAVTGTAPTSDAGPDSGSDADSDIDADSDGDADEDEGSSGGGGGCSVLPMSADGARLLVALLAAL